MQPPTSHSDLVRRRISVGVAAAVAAAVAAGIAPRTRTEPAGADHGQVVPPVPIPAISVRCADGTSATLDALVRDHVTASHLMFTGCSTVCPIQGAIFERVQALLPDQRRNRIQLLSLSIDPLDDTPDAMRRWLERFHARDGWIAAAPGLQDLNSLLDLFGQGRNPVENHATQVNIIDRRGKLIFRTPQLPSADSIADLLNRVR
jgi:protein SCO1/2